MYYRSQGYRYPKNMRIPANYSGNAFSENEDAEEKNELRITESQSEDSNEAELTAESIDSAENDKEILNDSSSAPEAASASATSLLRGFGGSSFLSRIGSEELLILALVLLLSDTDSDNDIIWLLLLLLFIK